MKVVCWFFFIGWISSCWSFSEGDYKEFLQHEIRAFLKKNNGAGCAVYVYKESLELEKPFEKIQVLGLSKRSQNLNLTESSLFRLGPLSKIFTILTLLKLEADALCDLKEPMETYFPKAFILPSHPKKKPTVKDVALELSGLPALPTIPLKTYQASEVDIRSYFKKLSLPRIPGIKYEPSTLGMSCLCYMCAKVKKKSFEAVVKEAVLDPLSLSQTYLSLPLAKLNKLTCGYHGIVEISNLAYERDGSFFKPAVGFFSTIEDLSFCLKFFLKKRVSSLEPLLKEIYKSHYVFPHSPSEKLTYCFKIAPLSSHLALSTYSLTSSYPGYEHYFAFIPELKCGIVILSNSEYSVEALGEKLLEALVR